MVDLSAPRRTQFSRTSEPGLVPSSSGPITLEEDLRLRCLDLPTARIDALRAEYSLLQVEIASRVWSKRRRGTVWVGREPVCTLAWLRERARRIDHEVASRRDGACRA